MSKIAVIIPCYNESTTIFNVVHEYKEALPEADVYVCDNNSKDDTAISAKKAGAVVLTETKQGKGYAVRKLFTEVDADCYLMVDGDSTYPADYAEKLVEDVLSDGVEMAVGDRLSGTYFTNNERPFHKAGNRLIRFLLKLLFRSTVNDPLSGMRAFSRKFVREFDVPCKGFELETELCIFAARHKYKTSSIPIRYLERPQGSVSKLSTVKDGIRILWVILKRLFQ